MPKKLDICIGQYLVQKQCCGLREVNAALREQARLRQDMDNKPLGEILVAKGSIDNETLKVVLAELGVLCLRCAPCAMKYAFSRYERGSSPRCPKCNEVLLLADPEQPVSSAPPGGSPSAPWPAPVAPEPSALSPPGGGPQGPLPAPVFPSAPNDPIREVYVGKVLGGCQLIEKVGHGGMGMVYKAKQLNLGRIVAVKVLSGSLAKDESFVRRFLQEARSAAHLNHGNIVHVNDVGEHQGIYYFVMEYVDGKNLKDILKATEPFEVSRATTITIQVCHALRHAHSRGVIHRDIKPENIMITQEGSVKLADLGLAKRMASDAAVGLTHAGSILGTPYYMAPEQAKDFSRVDHRSDIYSLGVTLYKMLTGKVPYEGRTPIEIMIKAIDGRKTPVRELRNEVSPELEEIVDKMMHRLPEKRYQDIESCLEDLNRVAVVVAV